MFRSFGRTSERFPMLIQPLASTTAPNRNPGIVPPWLREPITILPVDEPEFHILPVNGDTQFVPQSAGASPASLVDALRSR